MVPTTLLYIDGEFVPSSSGETFEVRNPYTGDVVGLSASASSADCKAAIDAAAKAFKTWEHSSLNERRNIFLKAADLIMSDKYQRKVLDAIQQETSAAAYMTALNGAPAASVIRAQLGMLDSLKGEIYPSGTVPGAQAISQRRAMGVMSVFPSLRALNYVLTFLVVQRWYSSLECPFRIGPEGYCDPHFVW